MVSTTGREIRAVGLQRLNGPTPLQVKQDANGTPRAVQISREWQPVHLIRPHWQVDAYWWRDRSVNRLYYEVAPEDGPPLTIFLDVGAAEWFRQAYQ